MKKLWILRSRQGGVALIIVLGCLFFLTVLILTFFTGVRTEVVSSKSNADNNSSRILSETAVNVVLAQIRRATTDYNTATLEKYAWASQPGMIRTFNTSGNLVNAYKLYSSGEMAPTIADPTAELTAMANWNVKTAWFTDLNEPDNTTGTSLYPIIKWPATAMDGLSKSVPGSLNETVNQPVPMPASWLYVLKDGTVVPPTGTPGNEASVAGATAANPIVGRIAFWTDDETSKVNINTAGGLGVTTASNVFDDIADQTFWDVPRFTSPTEKLLATRQPANNEFQRYPGHPGTVALQNTLAGLGMTNAPAVFYGQTPRYGWGGSLGATVDVSGFGATATPLQIRGDRLYASVSEFLFQMNLVGSVRPPQSSASKDKVAQAEFLLTAHSRAPELNLYGLPRVSMWPITDYRTGATDEGSGGLSGLTASQPVPIDPTPAPMNHISPTDKLLAFCATLTGTANALPYYFIRQSAADSQWDINKLTRNRTILTYLDQLTGLPIPGFGGSLRTKYTQTGARQILTEIFDYIRMTNSQDGGLAGGADRTNPGLRDVPRNPNWFAHDYTSAEGFGQISPSKVASATDINYPDSLEWNTQGFGNFPRLTEVAVQFIGMGENPTSNSGNTDASTIPIPTPQTTDGDGTSTIPGSGFRTVTTPMGGSVPTTVGNRAVQGLVYLNFVVPAQGWVSGGSNAVLVVVKGLNSFALNTVNMGFKSTGTVGGVGDSSLNNIMLIGRPTSGDPLGQGNFFGTMTMINTVSAGGQAGVMRQSYIRNSVPFYSKMTAVPISSTMDFKGGTITVEVYDFADADRVNPPPDPRKSTIPGNIDNFYGKFWPDNGNPNWLTTKCNLIQTYTITFPDQTIPVPGLTKYPIVGKGSGNFDGAGGTPPTTVNGVTRLCNADADRWSLRLGNTSPPNRAYGRYLIDPLGTGSAGDVIRSMVATGDFRTLAVSNVPSNAFAPVTGYTDTTRYLAHNMWYFSTTGMPGCANGSEIGRLINTANYPASPNSGDVLTNNFNAPYDGRPAVSPGLTGTTTTTGAPGDWDNGVGNFPDGPWINKPDEGNLPPNDSTVGSGPGGGYVPYYTQGHSTLSAGTSYFSPNRIVPSPGMLGSLPTGIDPVNPANSKHWQTLLFRPGPGNHPGERNRPAAGAPADSMFIDLFWMPQAEPYAISEPFSTAGKINMNYQIMPYTYINRSTAMRAVLAGEKVATNLPPNAGGTYKYMDGSSGGLTSYGGTTRAPLNVDQTLTQFDTRFGNGADVFRSAAEICDVYLVPKGVSLATFQSQWHDVTGSYALVGDNTRERPYANIYGKLTTKSNTYLVHYRVQILQKRTGSTQDLWQEGIDLIKGEKRGSTLIERYLDSAKAANIGDFAAYSAATLALPSSSLENNYKFRIINSTNFPP